MYFDNVFISCACRLFAAKAHLLAALGHYTQNCLKRLKTNTKQKQHLAHIRDGRHVLTLMRKSLKLGYCLCGVAQEPRFGAAWKVFSLSVCVSLSLSLCVHPLSFSLFACVRWFMRQRHWNTSKVDFSQLKSADAMIGIYISMLSLSVERGRTVIPHNCTMHKLSRGP